MYALIAAATAPWWMRKTRSGWSERFGNVETLESPQEGRPRLLLHAVSVGEVNLTRPLVDLLLPQIDVVVSASTDTGLARAKELYGSRCTVMRFPLDASWSVRKFLRRVRPDAVGLVELELWPNFATECRRRGIPIAVVNGRLSARSFKNYRRGRFWIGKFFRQLAFAAVQNKAYAQRFKEMGVAPERCVVAGSMKWDAAELGPIAGAEELAQEMGIDRSRPLVVGGSTAPGEHELLVDAVGDQAQLLCAPRRPEWFDQAHQVLGGDKCARRSSGKPGAQGANRFLLDTIGELRKAYWLADVVVVGRSFGNLYGSDPMEPAALGKAVVIGPRSSDFESAVEALKEAPPEGGIIQTDAAGLKSVISGLLADGRRRTRLGNAAQVCVIKNQGATRRHADLLLALMCGSGVTK